jgi:hypothetical protein
MKNTLLTCLILAAVTAGPALANANESEVTTITHAPLSLAGDGPSLGGYILVHYGDDDDGSEMKYRAVRVEMKGSQGVMQYAFSADFKGLLESQGTFTDTDGEDQDVDGTVSLKDAFATWSVSDGTTATFGRFKEPVLHSGIHSSSRRLMVERTGNGGDFDDRNAGLMLNGGFGDVQWWVAMQEGGDGEGTMEKKQTTVRAVYNVMGSAFGKYQGAYGYEGSNLSIGVASVEDDFSGLSATAMEVGYVSDGWCIYADMIDEDGGDSPTSLTLSRVVHTNYELAFRVEEDDDASDTSHLIAGLNWYQGGDGHNLKWQLNFTESESDNPANEGSRLDFGLVWRF